MVKIFIAALFIILAATFSTLNREEVTLRYFFGWSTPPFPLFLLLLASLVVGMVLGFSVDWRERWKLRAKARALGVQVKVLRDEVESLTVKEETPEPPPAPPEASKTTPS
ncbi:MAG TPA: LapA family protein [Thermodesulfobacteriota bacterium]|nr:LapA family protein [Thermodesulfobacteriota bacterium]